jgi:hypothetical protein
MSYIHYFCNILNKLDFPGQIFEKFSNMNFLENQSSGRRVFPYGQIDMMALNIGFSQFGERVCKL